MNRLFGAGVRLSHKPKAKLSVVSNADGETEKAKRLNIQLSPHVDVRIKINEISVTNKVTVRITAERGGI